MERSFPNAAATEINWYLLYRPKQKKSCLTQSSRQTSIRISKSHTAANGRHHVASQQLIAAWVWTYQTYWGFCCAMGHTYHCHTLTSYNAQAQQLFCCLGCTTSCETALTSVCCGFCLSGQVLHYEQCLDMQHRMFQNCWMSCRLHLVKWFVHWKCLRCSLLQAMLQWVLSAAGYASLSAFCCRLCFIECFVHRDDCSKELLEWGARVASANSRPPNPQ